MLERLEKLADARTSVGRFEVLRGDWPKPIEFAYEAGDPMVSTMFCASSYQVEGRIVGAARRDLSRVGRTFMLFPDRPFFGRGTGGPIRVARCIFDRAAYSTLVRPDFDLADAELARSLDLGSNTINLLIRRMTDEAIAPGFASEVMMESLASALLIECGREIQGARQADQEPRAGLPARYLRAIDDHLEQIEIGVPRIADLAALCGFSGHYLAKMFREATGCSLGRYIAEWQMRRARQLLVKTNIPLKEIAYRLGFANAANFSTAFRKEFAQTPGMCRKMFGEAAAPQHLLH